MIIDKLFAFQVALLFAIVFAVAFWMLRGAPLTGLSVQPVKPSAELPTFAESAVRAVGRQAGTTVAPDDIHRQERQAIGHAILTGWAHYKNGKCIARLRRDVVGRVEYLANLRRDEPATLRPATSADAAVEEAIATMFDGGYLTIDEFAPDTRTWLETFVGSASAARVAELKRCQAE